ncbi:uncharacterized protein LOC107412604 isoform X3 [Ziziphus jujuba]|uniref:Uncharacterized protein LOC107412604 isoform X3 n=1 Tax=Ziziphus jujuba TaxID=326968 RepID=A0ABM3ZTW7_ZIZJJ|nr:uncharacterized protein LOC107412604 isoform X3 [Ziziphus jujuba]
MGDQKSFSSSMDDQKALSSSNDGQQALSSSVDDQQATSFPMDNQQISSSSLEGQQEDIPQPNDESWFDLTNSCGKEFELPNVSDPMSLDLSINSNNLLVSPFQRLDIPCVLDNAFVLEITGPSSAGNQLVSLPLIEMVPSVTNTSSAIDQQVDLALSAMEKLVILLRPTDLGLVQMDTSMMVQNTFRTPTIE